MYRQRYPDDPGMHNSSSDNDSRRGHSHISRAPTFMERIRSSVLSVIVGIILIPGAIYILSYNEYRAVRTAKSLDEGLKHVVELHSSRVVDMANDGRLVHLTEKLSCDQVLADAAHGVAIPAVKLKREVEMYQWVEIEHRDTERLPNGDEETRVSYTYDKQWRSDLVRSQSFDNSLLHRNPDSMPLKSETWAQSTVQVGQFSLSQNLLDQVGHKYEYFTPKVLPDNRPEMKLHYKYIYYSEDPINPQVGDVRVSISYAGLCRESSVGPRQVVSVMGKQEGHHLTAYETNAGDIIEMLHLTSHSAKEMISAAKSANITLTWALRALGMFLNFIGFMFVSSLLTTLVSWLPVVRELVYAGTFMFSLSLAVSTSLFTIALSWIIYRPLYAVAILVLSAGLIVAPRFRLLNTSSHSRRYV